MTTSLGGAAHGRPILVIEDSDEDFEVLRSSLRAAEADTELERLSTGREIAEYLAHAGTLSRNRIPLLILLDLNLPGANGHDVLRQLRVHPLFQSVPVVMLTTSSQPSDIDACYRLGIGGYMVKPLELDRFESMVRSMSDYWLRCVALPSSRPVPV